MGHWRDNCQNNLVPNRPNSGSSSVVV
jgi:hypothetical protein